MRCFTGALEKGLSGGISCPQLSQRSILSTTVGPQAGDKGREGSEREVDEDPGCHNCPFKDGKVIFVLRGRPCRDFRDLGLGNGLFSLYPGPARRFRGPS